MGRTRSLGHEYWVKYAKIKQGIDDKISLLRTEREREKWKPEESAEEGDSWVILFETEKEVIAEVTYAASRDSRSFQWKKHPNVK